MTGNWITPMHIEITEGMKTVYDLLDEYKDYLDGTDRFKSFNRLSRNNPESARAEAVAYSFFKSYGYDVQPEETPNKGGVDFRVQAESTDFVVEVTSMLRKSYTKYSGMPEMLLDGVRCTSPYGVPPRIRTKVSRKVRQMSRPEYNCPRILMMACEHPEYHYFLNKRNPLGPEALLTGTPKIDNFSGKNITDLEDPLFLEFQNDRIVFCRESISAVLLFYISKYHAQATCLLHPKPKYNFSIELLPSVPFVEVLVPAIGGYSVGDVIRPRWMPDNLPDGLFVYNQWH